MSTESPSSHTNKNLAQKVATQLKLKDVGKNSFVHLCEQGCDAEFLGECFYFVANNPQIIITPSNTRRKQIKFSLRPLDSLKSALGGFETRQIESLQEKLREIATDIEKINSSSLVRHLDPRKLPTFPLTFNLPPLLNAYANKFIPFLLEKSKQVGSRQRPYFNLFMNMICDHVKEKTKRQQYRLICDVLNNLGIDWDVDAIKQWRTRHKSSPELVT